MEKYVSRSVDGEHDSGESNSLNLDKIEIADEDRKEIIYLRNNVSQLIFKEEYYKHFTPSRIKLYLLSIMRYNVITNIGIDVNQEQVDSFRLNCKFSRY